MNGWERRLSDEGRTSPQQARAVGLAAVLFVLSGPGVPGAVLLALDRHYLAVLPALGSTACLVLGGRALLRFSREGAGPSAWRPLLRGLGLAVAGLGLLVAASAVAGR